MRVKLGSGARGALWLAFALCVPAIAHATNGYFQIGYGGKTVAMGGAGVANPQDTMAPAANPAGLSFIEPGWDFGIRGFNPIRDAAITCRGACTRSVSDGSEREFFAIPSFGYMRRLDETMSVGLTLFGNGGINTSYHRNIYDEAFAAIGGAPPGFGTGFPNTSTLGVNLEQLLIAPTVSYRLNKDHAIGISPIFGFQRFAARGLGDFAALTSDLGSLSNRQTDVSVGGGVRVGWTGQVHPMVRLGVNYASKVYMTKFTRYSGLFANEGEFDIPSHVGLGIALTPVDNLTLAFDAQRIFYSDVESINNPGPTLAEFVSPGTMAASRRLGASNGIGFGWESIWAFKLGARYDYRKWTFRAGYNHADSPIPDDEVLINLIAPGTVEDHVTLGVSYRLSKHSEITVAGMHAFHNQQANASTAFLGSAAKFGMHENAIDIGYSHRF